MPDREQTTLHERLIAGQPTEELERKAEKARERANRWTREGLDLSDRKAAELSERITWA